MKDDAIEKLAQLLFDKIMEKQEQADIEYADQIQSLMNNGYVIDDVTNKLGINEEEKLVGELAKMQTIMMILEDKEEYEKAAIILKKINVINRKLNNGSGKY
jgi:DNA-binding protein H-NS|tara:strand:+ start:266 stop:571 length:306 start_codon:yes stop_codon:yes gene_type:complete